MVNSDSINIDKFEVIVPEVYNKCIPKYYMQVNKGDPPRLNGRRVTWDEYLEVHPEFVQDEEFTPDMVYTPCEMNETTSMETVAGMIDFINNNIAFSIANPDTTYPHIIDIIKEYLKDYTKYVSTDARIARYVEVATEALHLFEERYEKYQDRKDIFVTGEVQRPGTKYDKIERIFAQGV